MAYARPVYFIITTSLLQLVIYLVKFVDGPVNMYGFEVISTENLAILIEMIRLSILMMPIAFAMGFYSQLKTFLNFILEQIEYNCFGGSGSSGIGSATIALLRSVYVIKL